MKLSKNWLCETLGKELDTAILVDQLTMLGLEVDSVAPVAGEFSGVVVGEIIAAEPHPDAKRLRCCEVDVGGEVPLLIVCGGANARAGIKVACAKVGAMLPNDFEIKATQLRGQPSAGMLCSSSELGLAGFTEPENGIIELPEDAPVGEDIKDYLSLNDASIDIELTPNRGDCASLHGVAREVALVQESTFTIPSFKENAVNSDVVYPVENKALDVCPRYMGRVIKNISTSVKTPIAMQETLRRSGLRCIHPIVDILNFVMLECGQPMHAFDLDTLDGPLVIRSAKEGEDVTLLNDESYQLNSTNLVIADQKRVLAVAGVMGGADSGVSSQTKDLFLESAFFDMVAIRQSGARLNLHSDSRYRFERGVDYQLQHHALERATELIVSICGGDVAPIIEQSSAEQLPAQSEIHLRRQRIKRVLGVAFEDEQITQILSRLGLSPENNEEGWLVTIPSFRFDLTVEVDLIEEIARIVGYDNLPLTHQAVAKPMVEKTETQLSLSTMKRHFIARGFHEIIAYSFISESQQRVFCGEQEFIKLTNPISKDLEVMRGSLWPSLIQSMLHNQNRQLMRARLFEVGRVFNLKDGSIDQPMMVGLLASGTLYPEQWGQPDREVDFFDVKKDIEMLLALTHRSQQFTWKRCSHSALHPGQSVALYFNNALVGYLGRLHPSLAADLGCVHSPILFEATLSVLQCAGVPQFTALSKYPSMRRDIAVVINDTVSSDDILNIAKSKGGDILTNAEIFDIYQGEGIDSGQKSVALSLTFQHPSRTLVEGEVDTTLASVVSGLQQQLNATMRA